MTQETVQEMSPAAMGDPVAVVLERLFDIAKEWEKVWVDENRKYSFGFGFVKKSGFFFQVTDRVSKEKAGFYSQATGLTPDKMSQLMKQYGLRLKQLQPALDFASKKEGRKLKGRVPRQLKVKRK